MVRPREATIGAEEEALNTTGTQPASKVPEVTLAFWIVKVAATTLGETGGDAVSMSMNLGYLVGTAIFAAIFAGAIDSMPIPPSLPTAFPRSVAS